ncbi:molybdate ABC transporter permease subunit [bacterium]|nr:molybdate ABC transporter permease subunit [bacterium]
MTSAQIVLAALSVSLQVAVAALAIVLPVGTALAFALARGGKFRTLLDALVTLPLVLPPVAIGVLILSAFGRNGLGEPLARGGIALVGTWRGAAVASAVVALPVFVRVARAALEGVDPRLEQVAATLGASPARVALTVTLPLAARGMLAAATLAFARALGEFGATILVAGSVVGETQTLPLAIFEAYERGDSSLALALCLVSGAVALALAVVAARLEPARA